jgi:hypothetical protein
MPWYELVKAVHFFGLIALFGAFAIYVRASGHLRAADTLAKERAALGWLDATRGMLSGGTAMMLASGVVMVGLRWRGPIPFTTEGLVTLLLIWVVSLINHRHLRDVAAAAPAADGPTTADLRAVILRPLPWTIMLARNTAALGVLLVMTLKTGWAVSVAIVVILTAIGAVVGRRLAR